MPFRYYFYIIISGWFVFDYYFIYLKQGRQRGASLLLRRGQQNLLTFLVILSYLPVFLSLIEMSPFRLLLSFSGVGIGSIIIAAGILFQWYTIQLLGPFYTSDISVFKNHRIIESGWYKLIRHPQYLANLISFIGLSICFHDFKTQIMTIIFPAVNFFIQIRLEERALKEICGISYKNYILRTFRIIPYIY